MSTNKTSEMKQTISHSQAKCCRTEGAYSVKQLKKYFGCMWALKPTIICTTTRMTIHTGLQYELLGFCPIFLAKPSI